MLPSGATASPPVLTVSGIADHAATLTVRALLDRCRQYGYDAVIVPPIGLSLSTTTSSDARDTPGSGRSTIALAMLNIVLTAPVPSAMTMIATAVITGFLRNIRPENFRS